jgi:methionyl-tRNA formyltransferase
MRLSFLGSPQLAVPVLDALHEAGHEVAIVVTRPDRRRGRGPGLTPTPVKAAAERLGLEVTDDLAALERVDVDLGVVVAYGVLVPPSVLERAPLLNVHFSLLPRWRGAAPVERAILAGDTETGVCIMALEEALDTGPVYARAAVGVDDKGLEELRTELVGLGTKLLVDLLARGIDGLPTPVAQVGEPTYAKKVRDEELVLDFTRPAVELARVVRLGRARTTVEGARLGVLAASVEPEAAGAPGDFDGEVVTCSPGGLRLLTIVPEGRRAMDPGAWLRGLRGVRPTTLGTGPVGSAS